MEKKKIFSKSDVLFILALAGVILVHLSRIRMGMVEPDESFYLAIPFRYIQGDVPLIDEWNMGQMFGILIYPILKIYFWFVKDTEGIYLAFRYIWLVSSTTTAIISYFLLRRKNQYIGAAASVMISLFTYACIRALSYNTMITMAVWLFVVLSVTEIRHYKIKFFLMGLLMAAVILCNPFMFLYYIAYAIVCLIRREKRQGYYGLESLGYVTLGGAVVAILLLWFIFSRTTIFEFFQNLSGVLYNPSHKMKTVTSFFEPIINFVDWFKLYFGCYAVGTGFLIFGKKWKKVAFVSLLMLSSLLWILLIVFKTEGVGRFAIYLPMTMLGLSVFLATKKKNWVFFGRGWIMGIALACCMNLASNQGIYAILDACCISAAVSLFLVKDYLNENEMWFGKKIWIILLACLQIFSQIWINLNSVFWANDISELKYKIEEGPAKGVYTSEDKKRNYMINYENLKALGDLDGKKIMIFNYFSAGYMVVPEARCGAFSPWMTEYNTPDHEQFLRYYRLHPDRVPDIVYFDVESECDWTQEDWENWCKKNGL